MDIMDMDMDMDMAVLGMDTMDMEDMVATTHQKKKIRKL